MIDMGIAVKARSRSFGNFIDTQRELYDAPHLSLVRVTLPEYESSGLGPALLRVSRYQFTDLDCCGIEGMSVGADSSRGIMVYTDMNPVLVAPSHSYLQARNPEVAEALRQQGFPPELISVGVLRAAETDGTFENLVRFVETYQARATWIESHAIEVRFATLEIMAGGPGIDWQRALPGGPTFEI